MDQSTFSLPRPTAFRPALLLQEWIKVIESSIARFAVNKQFFVGGVIAEISIAHQFVEGAVDTNLRNELEGAIRTAFEGSSFMPIVKHAIASD